MILVGENTDNPVQNYNSFNLNEEIATIIQQNRLPQRIVEKLGNKIREYDIQLTKEQFYQLINRIEQALASPTSQQKKDISSDPIQNSPSETNAQDMQTLAQSVNELKKKISCLEKNQLQSIRGISNRLVHSKDIKTSSDLFESMQPLEGIPNDPESIVIVMKWLQYLVNRLGLKQLPEVLDYYVDIDWISDDVRLDLIRYSKGITEKQAHTEPSNLSTKQHIQSLLYIQKLKGVQLDERFLWRIDREIDKLGKTIDEYQFD